MGKINECMGNGPEKPTPPWLKGVIDGGLTNPNVSRIEGNKTGDAQLSVVGEESVPRSSAIIKANEMRERLPIMEENGEDLTEEETFRVRELLLLASEFYEPKWKSLNDNDRKEVEAWREPYRSASVTGLYNELSTLLIGDVLEVDESDFDYLHTNFGLPELKLRLAINLELTEKYKQKYSTKESE